jgi:hypothetical protein
MITHLLACFYKIAGDKTFDSDIPGWPDKFHQANPAASVWSMYMTAVYWASSQLSLVGTSVPYLAPTTEREQGFLLFANLLTFFVVGYFFAAFADILRTEQREQRKFNERSDQYMEMFAKLRIDTSLRMRVNDYWENHRAVNTISNFTQLLHQLPPQLQSYISVHGRRCFETILI